MSVSLHVSKRNLGPVLSLRGRVDAFADKRIMTLLRQAVPAGSELIVLDLSGCEFISLFGLKSLLEWKSHLAKEGSRLILFSPADGIRRALDVFLGEHFRTFWSWEELEIENFYQEARKLPVSGEARVEL